MTDRVTPSASWPLGPGPAEQAWGPGSGAFSEPEPEPEPPTHQTTIYPYNCCAPPGGGGGFMPYMQGTFHRQHHRQNKRPRTAAHH